MYSFVLLSLGFLCYLLFKKSKLEHIPTVGYSFPILSYISRWRFLKHGYDIIEEGYRKYPNKVWKFPAFELSSYIVVANGTHHVEEMAKAPDDVLSNILAFRDYLLLDYTLGPEVTWNPYHIAVVRSSMTRNISAQFEPMLAEIADSLHEVVSNAPRAQEEKDEGWVEIDVHKSCMRVITRVLARLSVGFPVCENEEYRDLCQRAVPTLDKGRMLRFFPPFLRPIIAHLFINSHRDIQRMAEIIEPIVRERLSQEEEYGPDWEGKPEDILTWLLEESGKTGIKRTAHDLATRIYFLSFASEGSAQALTNALFEITANSRSKYLDPLRAEIEDVLSSSTRDQDDKFKSEGEEGQGKGEGGWTKASISKLVKMDSLLREVQRCYDIQPLHLGRNVLRDFTFSDGTLVPAGSTIYVNSRGVHADRDIVKGARSQQQEEEEGVDVGVGVGFDGFRWCGAHGPSHGDVDDHDHDHGEKDKHAHASEDMLKQPLLMKPTLDYHAFGYGKHACPGRFVAAYQMKTILAYLLENYEVKAPARRLGEGEGEGGGKLRLAVRSVKRG